MCDSTVASLDLWSLAKNDLLGYIEKVAQRERLRKNRLDDVIEYCHTLDITSVIPVLKENYLLELAKLHD
jgi:2-phosphosulfolactate phosphatase